MAVRAQDSPIDTLTALRAEFGDALDALTQIRAQRGGFPPGPQAGYARTQQALAALDQALAAADWALARRAARDAGEALQRVWMWLEAEQVASELTPAEQRQLLSTGLARVKARWLSLKVECDARGLVCADADAKAARQRLQDALAGTDLPAARAAFADLAVELRRIELELLDRTDTEVTP